MTPIAAAAHYYEFLLDALDRVAREGVDVDRGWRSAAHRLGLHAAPRVLAAAARAARSRPGLVLEFGVYKGRSLRLLAKILGQRAIFGFDSFAGFPDDGRADWRGNFEVDALPQVPDSVALVKGYFDETLPAFMAAHADRGEVNLSLLHIDCDLYSSTRTVLDVLTPHLSPGTVIAFDELLHYPRFVENEFLALYEWLMANGLGFRWLAYKGRIMALRAFCEEAAAKRLPARMGEFRAAGHHQSAAIVLTEPDPGLAQRLARYRDEADALLALRPLAQDLSPTGGQDDSPAAPAGNHAG